MMRTTPVNYYDVEDVMRLTGYAICKCRNIIKKLNDELVAKGYLVIAGKVPKRYYHERYNIPEVAENEHKALSEGQGLTQ